ncbi:MAG: NifU N-terminal domain-containing protein [Hyphomicrobiales bacterium]|nr:NifU N-terminal domain-containing protein [Hyphomicrobiales bacterium]
MFIQTEATADPKSLKFLPGREVLCDGPLDMTDRDAAACSPLATRLFDIAGVAAISFGPDYITVTKNDSDWQHLKPALLGAIMEHFMSGAPILLQPARALSPRSQPGSPETALLGARVTDALRLVIDPELGYNIVDLGLVYDVRTEDGITSIVMTTTTRGCPATNYLKEGAHEAASSVEGVKAVEVGLTYDPPWAPEMMSPEAKGHFGIVD